MRYDLYFWDKTEASFWSSNFTPAIIALIGVILSVFLTHSSNRKINETNIAFQQKIKNDEIDANLKASARIEWIQEVRKKTAKLIALCYKLQNDYTPKYKPANLISDYSQIENDIPLQPEYFILLEKITNNFRKNNPGMSDEEISEGIDAVFTALKENPEYIQVLIEETKPPVNIDNNNIELSFLTEPRARKYYNDELFREKREQLISEIKETCCLLTLFFGPNAQNDKITDIVDKIDKSVSEVMVSEGTDIDLKEEFLSDVTDLSNKMRVYLKREWDRAKDNKD